MANPRDVVGSAVGLMALLLIGVVLLGTVFGFGTTTLGTAPTGNQTDAVAVSSGSGTIEAGSQVSVEEVFAVKTSLNDSVRLTGANDSNVSIDSSADLGHDFSVCTWATADSSVVSNNETRLLLGLQEAILWYNGTDDVWRGYYYNTSSRNSFRTNVSAPSPGTPTLVCLNHGGQTLNVTANTSIGANVTTGSSNTAAYPANVSNWNGTVEETRLYGAGPLNDTQRTEWVGEPVLALQGASPSTRVTYDTRAGTLPSSFEVFFASGSATPSNATLATGQSGPGIAEGSDYSVSGGTISILAGGALDTDGEVLYTEFGSVASDWSGTLTSMSRQFQDVFTLMNLIPFLLVAFLVIAMLRL